MSYSGPRGQTAEFHVSSRLVHLDPGLFSLALVPVNPDNPGLAGVRVCAPPGPPGRPDSMSVSGFRADGWLMAREEPLIIRVAPGGAEVMFTIYWPLSDGPQAPPGLRLARINVEAGPVPMSPGSPIVQGAEILAAAPARMPMAAPIPAPMPTSMPPSMPTPILAPMPTPAAGSAGPPVSTAEIVAHVQDFGDQEGNLGDWIGRRGSGRWIEGFRLAPRVGLSIEDLEVRAVLGRDWMAPWLPGGTYCGSRGLALPLRGFSVRLRPEAAARFDLAISARFVDGAEVGPLGSDRVIAAPGLSALEAFQIVARPKGV